MKEQKKPICRMIHLFYSAKYKHTQNIKAEILGFMNYKNDLDRGSRKM